MPLNLPGSPVSSSAPAHRRAGALAPAFALVFAAALLGDTDPFSNLAPTWVYVVFWLGVPALSVSFGNVWRALSPWRSFADLVVWLRELDGGEARPLAVYPERLGRYPAAAALFSFVALELAYADPSRPRSLAFAIALYTYPTLFGMAAFGRDTWERHGEGFAVLFASSRGSGRSSPRKVASAPAGRSRAWRAPSERRARSRSSR